MILSAEYWPSMHKHVVVDEAGVSIALKDCSHSWISFYGSYSTLQVSPSF
jgi:hypothetical protein